MSYEKAIKSLLEGYNPVGGLKRDANRIRVVLEACVERIAHLEADGKYELAGLYGAEMLKLAGKWLRRAAEVADSPWKHLFSDPFKGLREETRVYAKRWDLNSKALGELG